MCSLSVSEAEKAVFLTSKELWLSLGSPTWPSGKCTETHRVLCVYSPSQGGHSTVAKTAVICSTCESYVASHGAVEAYCSVCSNCQWHLLPALRNQSVTLEKGQSITKAFVFLGNVNEVHALLG